VFRETDNIIEINIIFLYFYYDFKKNEL